LSSLNNQGADTSNRILPDDPASIKALRMGDIVEVKVVLKSVTNALWLPPQAIRSFEGRNFVVVKSPGGQTSRTDVKIGIQNADRVEILDGLKEGQEIVAP
jgi:multidrug efflux pump subunit AcrA (membrane-fusion protein)